MKGRGFAAWAHLAHKLWEGGVLWWSGAALGCPGQQPVPQGVGHRANSTAPVTPAAACQLNLGGDELGDREECRWDGREGGLATKCGRGTRPTYRNHSPQPASMDTSCIH